MRPRVIGEDSRSGDGWLLEQARYAVWSTSPIEVVLFQMHELAEV